MERKGDAAAVARQAERQVRSPKPLRTFTLSRPRVGGWLWLARPRRKLGMKPFRHRRFS